MMKRKPDGLLVLYDEGKGVRKPVVRIFSPSARIEKDVNEWVAEQPAILVQRIEWIPSGGLLGASVTYTEGGEPTQSLRIIVPGLEHLERKAKNRRPLESFALFLLTIGIVCGFAGLALFAVFFPETWNGGPNALIEPTLAIQSTVLTAGLGLVLIFAGISALFRARIT